MVCAILSVVSAILSVVCAILSGMVLSCLWDGAILYVGWFYPVCGMCYSVCGMVLSCMWYVLFCLWDGSILSVVCAILYVGWFYPVCGMCYSICGMVLSCLWYVLFCLCDGATSVARSSEAHGQGIIGDPKPMVSLWLGDPWTLGAPRHCPP